MNHPTTSAANNVLPIARSWRHEPYMWLVLGLPLSVIAAGIVTVVIAARVMQGDPVLPKSPAQSAHPTTHLTPQQRAALEQSLAPAQQARNHAASPALPKQ